MRATNQFSVEIAGEIFPPFLLASGNPNLLRIEVQDPGSTQPKLMGSEFCNCVAQEKGPNGVKIN